MANKLKLRRGTKAQIETAKTTLESNELLYAKDTKELAVKNADGTVTYFGAGGGGGGSLYNGTTTGTSTAYLLSIPAIESLYEGLVISVEFNVANGANATLNLNSLGAKNIRNGNVNITASSISANGVVILTYDGTYWQYTDRDTNTTYPTITQAQIDAGTATTPVVVTPKLLDANYVKKVDFKIGNNGGLYIQENEPTSPVDGDIWFKVLKKPDIFPVDGAFLHFDASRLLYVNNDKVSEWQDISINGFDFIQATASNQPTFLSAGLNGKPTVQFVSNWMKSTFILDSYNGFTIFVVGKILSTTTGSRPMMSIGRDASTNVSMGLRWSSSSKGVNVAMNSAMSTGKSLGGAVNYDPFYYSSVYDMVNNKSKTNGVDGTTVAYAVALDNTQDGLTIGKESYSSATERIDMQISELVYFSSALTDTEITTINNYLRDKWGF